MNYDKKAKLRPNSPKYQRVHRWVIKQFGKADHCSFDNTHVSTRYDWSNKSREYKLERDDWQQLCRSCHRKFDKITLEGRASISNKNKVNSLGNNNASKPIVCVDTNIHYKSAREASKSLNILASSINNCLKGHSKSAGGYKWLYEGGVL